MSNAIAFNNFYAHTDVVVIGTDPEMADYDNPRGEIYGFSAHVLATNDYGDCRALHVATARSEREVLEQAEALAQRLTARVQNLGKLPVGFKSWVQGRPVYGSQAYQDYGREDDLSWEREMEECY